MSTLTRRSFLGAAAGAALAQQRRPPNVVLILADDLGYGDLACYGHPNHRTPQLDALARGGVRFTDFHSNGAVCSPTRAALMTGRYQQRCGITEVLVAAGPRDRGLPEGETTFAAQLKKAGYRTGIFGKWHLGYQPRFNPTHFGWDEFRGYVSGNVDYFSHLDLPGNADWWNGAKLEPEEGYTTDLITRHSIKFIEENRERPFCLYMANEAVHSPYQGPDGKAERLSGPAQRSNPTPAVYGAMLQAMDTGIGRVMETLRRLKLERDTFVFFFSDNGATAAGSNGACRGHKGQVWEGGHRVPAIAYWPGKIPAGVTSAETAIGLDLFPTLAGVAGAPPPPRKLDGASLLPHLTRKERLPRRTLFWGAGQQRAVRQGEWKLTLMPKEEPFLANLGKDFSEETNLAAAEAGRVRAMREELAKWEKDVSG